jgi:hypothetical protein
VPFTYQNPPQPTIESQEVQWPPYWLPPNYTPPVVQDQLVGESS